MRIRIGRGAFIAAVLLFLVTLCLFLSIFRWQGRAIATVELSQKYYFLVRECRATTAGAIAEDTYIAGGAGYLLADENAVVVACYYSQTDAEYVREIMQRKGIETEILARDAQDFRLNGKMAAQKERVEANVGTVESCARILFDAANGLERSDLTQEGARAAVRGVASSLSGLCGGNGEGFSLWNVELLRAERRAKELSEGILFSKDLRYLQVELCCCILDCGEYFR